MNYKLQLKRLCIAPFMVAMSICGVYAQQVVIQPDSIDVIHGASIQNLLRGEVAGVLVRSSEGGVTQSSDVVIGGVSTIRGDYQPLYILDGVMLNNPKLSHYNQLETSFDANDYQGVVDLLSTINSEDIESIEVLNRASSTALYGDLGGAGVVIIKTKRATADKTHISWSSSVKLSTISNKLDVLDGGEYSKVAGLGVATTANLSGAESANWQDEGYSASVSHKHNFSLRSHLRGTNYYFSALYSDENSIVKNSDMQTVSIFAGMDRKVGNVVELSTSFALSNLKARSTYSAAMLGTQSHTVSALSAMPLLGQDQVTPDDWISDYDDEMGVWRVIPHMAVKFNILDWLSFDLNGGIDYVNSMRQRWFGSGTALGAEQNGVATNADIMSLNYNGEATLNVDKKFSDGKGHLTSSLGLVYYGQKQNYMTMTATDFFSHRLRANGISTGASSDAPFMVRFYDHTIGGVASASYSYDDRYEITAVARVDHQAEYDYQNLYPAVRGRWNFTNEDFFPTISFLDSASLSAGWGKTGKVSTSPYLLSTDLFISTDYAPTLQESKELNYYTRLNNQIEQWDVALNLSFLNSRLGLDIGYFRTRASDILSLYDFREEIENRLTYENEITYKTNGLEIGINGVPIKRDNFTWRVSTNMAFNNNQIFNCNAPTTIGDSYGYPAGAIGNRDSAADQIYGSAVVSGASIGAFYGYVTDGVVTQNSASNPTLDGTRLEVGDLNIVDLSGDGIINSDDMRVIGDPTPDFYFGLNMDFQIKKRWVVGMDFDGMVGNDVLNLNKLYTSTWSGSNNVSTTSINDNTFTSAGYDVVSDVIVEDGSYIRLSNLSVGYTFEFAQKKLHSLVLSLAMSNLFVLSHYDGYDPEVSVYSGDITRYGMDYGSMPMARTVSLAVKLNF